LQQDFIFQKNNVNFKNKTMNTDEGIYFHHKEVQIIFYNLYGKGKIECNLIEYYGHHRPDSTYHYKYKHEIIPINK
jgi:hypothetical protein